MKQLLILIAILATLTTNGQTAKSKHNISIGYSVAPAYSFRTLNNNDGNSSSDIATDARNKNELAKFGYRTGVNFLFSCSGSVGFETGIILSSKGYKTKKLNLTFAQPDPSSPVTAQFNYSYQYIGIPLKARFMTGKNKLRFISSVGFTTNFLSSVKHNTKYEYADGRTDNGKQSSTSGLKKVDISPTISAGIDYKLNDKIYLIVEPMFEYGVIKTRDTPVTEHLWDAGINIGFYYGLK